MSAWTPEDLADLNKAMKSGVQQVEFQSRRLTYHGMTDLLKLRTDMLNDIAASSGTSITRQLRIYTDRGW